MIHGSLALHHFCIGEELAFSYNETDLICMGIRHQSFVLPFAASVLLWQLAIGYYGKHPQFAMSLSISDASHVQQTHSRLRVFSGKEEQEAQEEA